MSAITHMQTLGFSVLLDVEVQQGSKCFEHKWASLLRVTSSASFSKVYSLYIMNKLHVVWIGFGVILTFSRVCIAGSWEWRWKTDKSEVSLIYLSFWPGPSIGDQWATCKQEVIPKWHKPKSSVFSRLPLPLGLLFPHAKLHRVLKMSHW